MRSRPKHVGPRAAGVKHVAPHGIHIPTSLGHGVAGSSHVIPTPPGPATLLRPRTPHRAGEACMGPSPACETAACRSWRQLAVPGGAGDDGSDHLCVALNRRGSAVSGSVVARPVCAAQVGPLHPVGGCFGGSLRPPWDGNVCGSADGLPVDGAVPDVRSVTRLEQHLGLIATHSGPTEHTRTPDTTARRPRTCANPCHALLGSSRPDDVGPHAVGRPGTCSHTLNQADVRRTALAK